MRYDMTRRPYRGGSLFPEMVPLRSMMDRLLENAFMPATWGEGQAGEGSRLGGFGMDIEEDENAYYVRCHLPGVNPDDVNVQFHDNVLTISGEMRRETPEGRRQVFRETGHGQFQRQITLGAPIDADRAEAAYEHGVLEIKLPKSEAVRPRAIPVRGAGGATSQRAGAQAAGQSATGSSAASSGTTGGTRRRSTSRSGQG